jgi:hypothetical protein
MDPADSPWRNRESIWLSARREPRQLLDLNHERLTYRYAGRDFRLTNCGRRCSAADICVVSG